MASKQQALSGDSTIAIHTASRRAGPDRKGAANGKDRPRSLPADLGEFGELELRYDPERRILWYYLTPSERPCFTLRLLDDIRTLQKRMVAAYEAGADADWPIRYLVARCPFTGMFNLGGDLTHFLEIIDARDRDGLAHYAKACIDVLYTNMVALELPLVTVSLVQGDALGGGFEAAISSNLVVAERRAKFGLPEVLFNLFPGMGGYSLLARKLGPVEAERMILSGKIYSAEELYEMGAIDVLAEDGTGEAALCEAVEQHDRKFNSHLSVYRSRRQVFPVTYDELMRIGEVWVDAALRLSAEDLHRISLLAKAQLRRWHKMARTA